MQTALQYTAKATALQYTAKATALQYTAKAKAGSHGQSMQAVLQWLDGELRQTGDESRTKLGNDSIWQPGPGCFEDATFTNPWARVKMFKTQRLTDLGF